MIDTSAKPYENYLSLYISTCKYFSKIHVRSYTVHMQAEIPVEFQGIRRRTKGDLHKQLYKDHLTVCKYVVNDCTCANIINHNSG